MLFKRILSNLIDTIIFWLVYFVCLYASALPIDEGNSGFMLFLSFLLVVVMPVFFVNNTFGKIMVGLSWEQEENLKIKLLIKYFIYFAAATPSLRVSSALDGLIHGTAVKTASVIFADGLIAVSFVITDLFVFFLSRGKYHVNDYILRLTIHDYGYTRSAWRLLGMSYLFTAALVSMSAFLIRKDLQPPKVEDHLKSFFFNEQFSSDRLYGSKVLVLKESTNHVFAPSDPATFLFSAKKKQKTLFVNLPYEVFQSLEARRKICLRLLEQSSINDIFNLDQPQQLRIILSSIKIGKFLNYYNYYRVYYFDREIPGWGIYGGIKADSTTNDKYVAFLSSFLKNRSKVLEQKMGMPMAQVFKKIQSDSILKKRFLSELNLHFKFSWTTQNLNIQLDNSKIKFEKIDFADSHLYGYAQINFPVSNVMTSFNFVNIFSDRIEDADDNVFSLLQIRELTNEHL